MYIPSAFVESDSQKLLEFIDHHSFGTLISRIEDVPFATHLPMLVDRTNAATTLIGHTARANPQCAASAEQTVLAIFSGPHSYISPAWYASDSVVPTWNYVAVHVYGKLHLIENQDDLFEIVDRMTNHYEQSNSVPWTFDGSTTYADRLLSQIIGFRLEIERIEGKWKISQNQPVERQQKVIDALERRGGENAQSIAGLMRQRLNPTT